MTHAAQYEAILNLWREFYPGSGPTPDEFAAIRAAYAFDVRVDRAGRVSTKWDRMNDGQRVRAAAKWLRVKPSPTAAR